MAGQPNAFALYIDSYCLNYHLRQYQIYELLIYSWLIYNYNDKEYVNNIPRQFKEVLVTVSHALPLRGGGPVHAIPSI